MPEETFTVEQVVQMTGIRLRTIRHWTAKRVFDPPAFHGSATRYTREHVARIRAIAMLRGRGMRLDDVRRRIAKLSLAQLEAELAPTPTPALTAPPEPPPVPHYPADSWERVVLLPGLELHVNTAGAPVLRRIAEQIYTHYAARPASR